MLAPLLLLAALIIPSAPQQQPRTVDQQLVALSEWLRQWKDLSLRDLELLVGYAITTADFEELVNTVQAILNATSQLLLQCNTTQLLIDLQVLKGRQAVGGAVQGGQVFMFLAYLVTIAVFYLVKHCRKHQEEVARTEFELLEAKLQANRSKRRAAAARAGKQSPQ